MINENLHNIIDELTEIGQKAEFTFGDLTPEQINWKPSAESWSIGQCFEHLIKSNELYFADFERIAKGDRKNSFLENFSPFSRFFGKFIANSLKKDSQKVKTIPDAVPPSKIEADIIEKFAKHQAELIEKIGQMKNADWNKTRLTSPFLKVATYNLNDTFQIIIEHERRHFRQAERVLESETSPK